MHVQHLVPPSGFSQTDLKQLHGDREPRFIVEGPAPQQSGYVATFDMSLCQRQTCMQHVLSPSTGVSHGRSFSLV